jgi:4-hydroxy-4-methyl-2-oxoglutarate aldolase
LLAEELENYKHRLMGLIPLERIKTVTIPRPRKEIIETLMALDGVTPTISDVLDAMGMNGTIAANHLRPVIPGKKIVGPAVTIRYIPESITTGYGYQHQERAKLADRDVYAIAEAGDVPVFDGGGMGDISVMGGLSTFVAKKWRMAGNIVYGGVRDVDVMHQLDYPVWALGQTPKTGKYRLEAIEINGPIAIAGVRVNPGDLIVADSSGVVVIPSSLAEEVTARTVKATQKEEEIVRLLEQGASMEQLTAILPPNKW